MTDRFAEQLLTWYDQHGRHDLPWHHDRTAYRVWVSEIMLQQTQVATVIPYYETFMARFPDVETLARAPVDDVLSHWSGLGYYARARHLHKAARQVVEQFGGRFPEDPETLETLAGIGRSTAAAIVAQAYGRRAAILDGNVKRVLARYHAVPGWPGQTRVLNRLWTLAETHTPEQRVRDYTQAIMDLGALICTRSAPRCDACPVRSGCEARARGATGRFPEPRPKKAKPEKSTWMVILEDRDGRILLERRPPTGIWGGLWSLPELDPAYTAEELPHACLSELGLACSEATLIGAFRHTFSHYHLHIQPARLTVLAQPPIAEPARFRWLYRDEALTLGLPAPIRGLLTEPEQAALL
ncbi:A/G-specific adenine glycosylase [uncultured Marinobacter sp.]|jgi:A/G-specific adenine glycosylase|uniref:A/G-specific adenine glycosylase n=1 Tax=uncultured Marinobacter sp. TaxID=187379 RepID=UPI000C09DECB|nr:A/G-specific adenine glycosylase [Marinobacter sp.]MBI42894.1 A/G-specific adenine glycosylase [Oceanospirillales bacterium]|tara:strand:+ start:4075 stop:5139 length:1065 start_codon:yes stop_codon:yes gene_type:complete